MSLHQYIEIFSPVVEAELQSAVNRANGSKLDEFRHMLAYHMGWEGEGAGPEARGKRIRSILVLLTSAAAGGEWHSALPAACAVELIHNFSLIHDDIEDNSPRRRGRPSLWNKWSVAHATNAGDAMFTLAHLEILRLSSGLLPETVIQAARLLQQTCLYLTQGQYLDLSYEQRVDLNEADYWLMVSGKTAALLATCTELGAIVAEAPSPIRQAYRDFGNFLGLAFQAQDDLLGIWGDVEVTGKSAEGDLVTGKKTLPILYGLNQKSKFYDRWQQGLITTSEVPQVAQLLEAEGAKQFVQAHVDRLTEQAIRSLDDAHPRGEAGAALLELANQLIHRQS